MADEIRVQDEILQVLYWLRGEGLGEAAQEEQVVSLLGLGRAEVAGGLAHLAERALVTRGGGGWRLTERGIAEGGRRFQDEFAPYLGRESHLTCDDPDCDCHAEDFDGVCRNVANP